MPSSRRFRRAAKKVRRAGARPVGLLDPGDLSHSPAQMAVRFLWLYRSELAPVLAAVAVFLAGWFAHASTPHWWPAFLIGSALAAWALVTFGAGLGLPQLAARAHAGACVFAAGSWVAYTAVVGPLAPPLPLVLAAVTLALAVPWWRNPRRRAWARVERTVGAWGEIAPAIGLPR